MRPEHTPAQRTASFWSHVNKDGPPPAYFPLLGNCWLWTGQLDRKGYGKGKWGNAWYGAHRKCYELVVGPIPHGLQLDHLCRVHACVRPEHLEPVTNRVNVLRGNVVTALFARPVICPRGHRYDRIDKNGYRRCSTCAREYKRSYRTK